MKLAWKIRFGKGLTAVIIQQSWVLWGFKHSNLHLIKNKKEQNKWVRKCLIRLRQWVIQTVVGHPYRIISHEKTITLKFSQTKIITLKILLHFFILFIQILLFFLLYKMGKIYLRQMIFCVCLTIIILVVLKLLKLSLVKSNLSIRNKSVIDLVLCLLPILEMKSVLSNLKVKLSFRLRLRNRNYRKIIY